VRGGVRGACGAIAYSVKPESIGDYLKLVSECAVGAVGGGCDFSERGFKPGSYLIDAAGECTDAVTNEFLRERVGVTRLNEFWRGRCPGRFGGAVLRDRSRKSMRWC